MIGTIFAVTVGLLLSIVLVWIVRREASYAQELHSLSDLSPNSGNPTEFEVLPQECVAQIFSQQDWEFISRSASPPLQRLFLQERKNVAIFWVRQTSLAVRKIMRMHSEAAKRASDIEFNTEVSLFLRYIKLLALCETLLVLIAWLGPTKLQRITASANGLAMRINHAHGAFAQSCVGLETDPSAA